MSWHSLSLISILWPHLVSIIPCLVPYLLAGTALLYIGITIKLYFVGLEPQSLKIQKFGTVSIPWVCLLWVKNLCLLLQIILCFQLAHFTGWAKNCGYCILTLQVPWDFLSTSLGPNCELGMVANRVDFCGKLSSWAGKLGTEPEVYSVEFFYSACCFV